MTTKELPSFRSGDFHIVDSGEAPLFFAHFAAKSCVGLRSSDEML